MAIYQIIDVISVGYCFVAAVHAVNVRLIMTGTFVAVRAFFGIRRGYLDSVVLHMIAMGVV